MRRLLTIMSCVVPLLATSGCLISADEEEVPTPDDNGLEPADPTEAKLLTLAGRNVPSSRPYQVSPILAGALTVTGRYQGNSWDLAFAAGPASSPLGAQAITSSSIDGSSAESVETTWATDAFESSALAGSDPESDDLFTLLLTAHGTPGQGEDTGEVTDNLQVHLDNTPPIALITRLCRDIEGTDCFGFTENPADFGATNRADEIYQVSRSTNPALYVFGIAQDKNFAGYSFRMIGGEAAQEAYLCGGTQETTTCGGNLSLGSDTFGFGTARDERNQPTLSRALMNDAYSDDALVMVWDISYLTPDAYGLSLRAASNAFVDGDDDPQATATWITFLVVP